MRIALYGATGRVGWLVMREALCRRHEVTAVVRDPARLADRRPGLWTVTGDVLDPVSVARIAAGHDVLISAVGARGNGRRSVHRDAAESLTSALRALGPTAPRLVTVGGSPASDQPDAQDQQAAYEFLRTVSDVAWSYVSPAARIGPGGRTGRYRTGTDEFGHRAGQLSPADDISLEDYAVALVDEAEQPRSVGCRLTVAY